MADAPIAPERRTTAELTAFIEANTAIATPPLLPEVRLRLATEVTPLWQASEKLLHDEHLPPPFWAFAWPGGQAVARHILDHPDLVRRLRVLDLGAGSGLVGIAAALAGAVHVTAADLDPFACAAVRTNAALNGVCVEIAERDVTAWDDPDVDVILAGDVCYERGAADRITRWIGRQAARGVTVLLGDPGRTYLPAQGLERVALFDVPTSTELESGTLRQTGVWRVVAEPTAV